VLGREAQVGDEVLEVVLEALDGGRVDPAPLRRERLGPAAGDGLGGRSGLGVDVIEDLPDLTFYRRLGLNGHLGEDVPRPVDLMPMSALDPLRGYLDAVGRTPCCRRAVASWACCRRRSLAARAGVSVDVVGSVMADVDGDVAGAEAC
jgi:hypothetical protein